MPMPVERYYKVHDKNFKNLWRAYEHSKETGFGVEGVMGNSVWSNLPKLKIDLDRDYITDVLRSHRAQHRDLRILYSGGTDSETMMVRAFEGGIKLDQVFHLAKGLEPNWTALSDEEYRKTIPKWQGDPEFDRVFVPSWNKKKYLENVMDPNWIYETCAIDQISCQPRWRDEWNTEATYLMGYEKPHVIYHDGGWWMTILTNGTDFCFQDDNVINFYYDHNYPELALWQAHRFRLWWISRYGVPRKSCYLSPGKVTSQSRDDIMSYNRAVGRINARDQLAEHWHAKLNYGQLWTGKNAEFMVELWRHDDGHIIKAYADRILENYHNLEGYVRWQYPPTRSSGIPAWLVNIDTCEYLTAGHIGEWLG